MPWRQRGPDEFRLAGVNDAYRGPVYSNSALIVLISWFMPRCTAVSNLVRQSAAHSAAYRRHNSRYIQAADERRVSPSADPGKRRNRRRIVP